MAGVPHAARRLLDISHRSLPVAEHRIRGPFDARRATLEHGEPPFATPWGGLPIPFPGQFR